MSDELVKAIREQAAELGVSPMDIATAMSYETGGTFDKWQKGPTTQWGQHRGLIQWGEPQREKYGVTKDMSITDQVRAAGRYLKDTGVKPGMGLMDIYSAINAGGVGRYGASDANNGGAPGTVADKVNNQMRGHMENAQNLFLDPSAYDAMSRNPLGSVLSQPAASNAPPIPTGPTGAPAAIASAAPLPAPNAQNAAPMAFAPTPAAHPGQSAMGAFASGFGGGLNKAAGAGGGAAGNPFTNSILGKLISQMGQGPQAGQPMTLPSAAPGGAPAGGGLDMISNIFKNPALGGNSNPLGQGFGMMGDRLSSFLQSIGASGAPATPTPAPGMNAAVGGAPMELPSAGGGAAASGLPEGLSSIFGNMAGAGGAGAGMGSVLSSIMAAL